MDQLGKLSLLLRTAAGNPRMASLWLKLWPSLVRGVEFSHGGVFSAESQATDAFPEAPNPLLSYFNKHREGPGIWKWEHYFEIYHRHFSKFIGREVHVMEVGIYSGGSLPMWREYFGKGCRVYGVDIQEACTAYKDERIEILIGDQADRSFWAKVRHATPKIDILIDDGGHIPEHQIVTLEEMLPHIRPGGVYLCEDIHSTSSKFMAFIQGLANSLNSTTPAEMPAGATGAAFTPSEFPAAISSIHLYPFVAVIEKRQRTLAQLVAPMRGTRWQPFLSSQSSVKPHA